MENYHQSIVKAINDDRKRSKGQWYVGRIDINGNTIEYKGYSRWLQRLVLNGYGYHQLDTNTVKEFKRNIYKALREGLK